MKKAYILIYILIGILGFLFISSTVISLFMPICCATPAGADQETQTMSCITDAKEICTFTGEMPPGWEATKYEIWTNDGIKEMACAELIDCICEDSQLRCAEPA